MDFMKKVIVTACLLSVAITIVGHLKPGERFSRQLNIIFALVFISGVLSCAVKTGVDFDFNEYKAKAYSEEYTYIESNADKLMESEIESRICSAINELLKNKTIECDEISADVNINEDGSIDINRINYRGEDFERAKKVILENFDGIEVNRIE